METKCGHCLRFVCNCIITEDDENFSELIRIKKENSKLKKDLDWATMDKTMTWRDYAKIRDEIRSKWSLDEQGEEA